MCQVVAAAFLLTASLSVFAQPPQPFIPVGLVVGSPRLMGDEQTLMGLGKRGFNVLARRDEATGELRLVTLAAWLGHSSAKTASRISTSGVVVVPGDTSVADIRFRAWHAIAKGARGVLFDSALALTQNGELLEAAASFADNVTRNAALFAPLRPSASTRAVRVDLGPSIIDARLLESSVALVFIAVNLTSSVQRASMTFSPDVPEAIWQNMETGAAVSFVAGPEGLTYARTFAPFDVVVLMIRKQFK
jgi:hypothetical protein